MPSKKKKFPDDIRIPDKDIRIENPSENGFQKTLEKTIKPKEVGGDKKKP